MKYINLLIPTLLLVLSYYFTYEMGKISNSIDRSSAAIDCIENLKFSTYEIKQFYNLSPNSILNYNLIEAYIVLKTEKCVDGKGF